MSSLVSRIFDLRGGGFPKKNFIEGGGGKDGYLRLDNTYDSDPLMYFLSHPAKVAILFKIISAYSGPQHLYIW